MSLSWYMFRFTQFYGQEKDIQLVTQCSHLNHMGAWECEHPAGNSFSSCNKAIKYNRGTVVRQQGPWLSVLCVLQNIPPSWISEILGKDLMLQADLSQSLPTLAQVFLQPTNIVVGRRIYCQYFHRRVHTSHQPQPKTYIMTLPNCAITFLPDTCFMCRERS